MHYLKFINIDVLVIFFILTLNFILILYYELYLKKFKYINNRNKIILKKYFNKKN